MTITSVEIELNFLDEIPRDIELLKQLLLVIPDDDDYGVENYYDGYDDDDDDNDDYGGDDGDNDGDDGDDGMMVMMTIKNQYKSKVTYFV